MSRLAMGLKRIGPKELEPQRCRSQSWLDTEKPEVVPFPRILTRYIVASRDLYGI